MMTDSATEICGGERCIRQGSPEKHSHRIYERIYMKRFIITSVIMWLWRHTSPTVCDVCKLETLISFWCPSHLKVGWIKTQDELAVQVQSQERSQCPNLKVTRQEEFSLTWERVSLSVVYSGLHLIGRGPPTLGRAICFPQPTHFSVNLIQKHPGGNSQDNVWPWLWIPRGPVKLTDMEWTICKGWVRMNMGNTVEMEKS